MRSYAIFVVAVSLCWLLGCATDDRVRDLGYIGGAGSDGGVDGDSSGSGGDTGSSDVTNGAEQNTDGCSGMDLLFVIDDSVSMNSVKVNLASNLPKFVEVLDEYNESKGGQISYRIAVTSTAVERDFRTAVPNSDIENPFATNGDDGVFLGGSACNLAKPWIVGPGPDFESEFKCLADVSVNQTSNIEMPMAAIEEALGRQSEPGMPNAGFYRRNKGSLLVVVVITNEEDCSIEDGGLLVFTGTGMCDDDLSTGLYAPDRVKSFFDDISGGQGRHVLIAIAGPGPGKCESVFGEAWDAIRIRKIVDEFGEFGVFGSLCENDLWISLEQALKAMTTSCDTLPPII